nr:CD1871A family CXXC motif-containing protein [uncultured Clostridium sp.]
MVNKQLKTMVQCGFSLLAVLSMLYGTHRDEVDMVLSKAVNICLECIGLG